MCAGIVDEIVFEALTQQLNNVGEYKHDSQFINGMPNFTCVVHEHIKMHESKMIHIRSVDAQNLQEVEFHNFPPGSAIALRYEMMMLKAVIIIILIIIIIRYRHKGTRGNKKTV